MNKLKLKELASTLPDNQGLEWVDEAKCMGQETSLFVYPSRMPTASQRHILQKTCEGCPVMLQCRYESIRNMDEGWWGGMDEPTRLQWAEEHLFRMTVQ